MCRPTIFTIFQKLTFNWTVCFNQEIQNINILVSVEWCPYWDTFERLDLYFFFKIWYFFVCRCVCMCVYVCVCIHVSCECAHACKCTPVHARSHLPKHTHMWKARDWCQMFFSIISIPYFVFGKFFFVFLFVFLRQDWVVLELTLYPRLSWNSQRSSRLCIPSSQIKGVHHCAWCTPYILRQALSRK